MPLQDFEQRIGYSFRDASLLEMALTHRSYAFEHSLDYDNQRLEFLGDAVLSLVIGGELYAMRPADQEGVLSRLRSRLVCEQALAILAQRLGFDTSIRMGKGELASSSELRPGTLADAYEAVIGAIYLDGGLDAAKDYILRHHAPLLADPDGTWLPRDAKSRLQEIAQANHKELAYQMVSVSGPEHAPVFEYSVFLGQKAIASGVGHNKKEAQQAAAENALELLSVEDMG